MEPYGWAIMEANDRWSVMHTTGFYVMGFRSFAEAAVWLQTYCLADLEAQRKERLLRDQILAQMEPYRGTTQ